MYLCDVYTIGVIDPVMMQREVIAEADGKRMVKDVMDQRRKQMERAGEPQGAEAEHDPPAQHDAVGGDHQPSNVPAGSRDETHHARAEADL